MTCMSPRREQQHSSSSRLSKGAIVCVVLTLTFTACSVLGLVFVGKDAANQVTAATLHEVQASIGELHKAVKELAVMRSQQQQRHRKQGPSAVVLEDGDTSGEVLQDAQPAKALLQTSDSDADADADEQQQEQAEQRAPPPWYEGVDIDFVFAWYNHTDPERQRLYQELKPGAVTFGTEPNRGEIFLSLASVHAYAPWARRVYVVVPPGQGDALRLDVLAPGLRDKVRVVTEDEFIPAEHLPTFSSMTLEAHLHRVPGVSDVFVYMNDDFMLGKALPKSLVLSPERMGTARAYMLEWKDVLSRRPSNDVQAWQWPFFNAAELMRRTLGTQIRHGWHAGYVLTKAAYEASWALFGEHLARTASHKFRTYAPLEDGGDVVPHLLVQSVAMRLGLQRLELATHLRWQGGERVIHDEAARAAALGDGAPPFNITFVNSDSRDGFPKLPGGLFEAVGADAAAAAVTADSAGDGNSSSGGSGGDSSDLAWNDAQGSSFVNFNKLQHMDDGAFARLCRELVEVMRGSFDPSALERGCLCEAPEVGKAC